MCVCKCVCVGVCVCDVLACKHGISRSKYVIDVIIGIYLGQGKQMTPIVFDGAIIHINEWEGGLT